MNITEPVEVLVHFLRTEVDEITRTGVANRQTTTSQSFSGNGTTDTFTLTSQPVCINSVVVDSVTQTLFLHYDIDIDNKKVIFKTGYVPGVGVNNVVVSFDTGTNWIYPDYPREDLKKTNYPRIGVTQLTENSVNQGMGETDSYDTLTFQIDVVGFKDQLCTISSEQKSDMDVIQYLARQVIKKIKLNRSVIQNKLYDPYIINNFPVPFQDDKHIVRRIIEVSYKSNNVGE